MDECHRQIVQCQKMAEKSDSPLDKKAWLELAAHWIETASQVNILVEALSVSNSPFPKG
jgi:hypothetical protein